MADFKVMQANGNESRVVTICGKLTIPHAQDIKVALIEVLAMTKHIELDLKEVTDVDLTGIQLLCALHRDTVNLKKKLSVSGNSNELFSDFSAASGFPRHIGCVAGEQCIWGGGGN